MLSSEGDEERRNPTSDVRGCACCAGKCRRRDRLRRASHPPAAGSATRSCLERTRRRAARPFSKGSRWAGRMDHPGRARTSPWSRSGHPRPGSRRMAAGNAPRCSNRRAVLRHRARLDLRSALRIDASARSKREDGRVRARACRPRVARRTNRAHARSVSAPGDALGAAWRLARRRRGPRRPIRSIGARSGGSLATVAPQIA